MDITKTNENGTLTLALSGRVDTNTAPLLEKEIGFALSEAPGTLALDFAGTSYISSAGLRVILSAYKLVSKSAGAFKLTNVNASVLEILEATGFTDFLVIES